MDTLLKVNSSNFYKMWYTYIRTKKGSIRFSHGSTTKGSQNLPSLVYYGVYSY